MTRLPSLVDGELQCERCGELERQGMPLCTQSNCLYSPDRASTEPKRGAILVFIMGLGLLALTVHAADGGGSAFLLLLVIGVAFCGIGIYGYFGTWITLFNPENGALSRRLIFLT
jgi:hypothetical protein